MMFQTKLLISDVFQNIFRGFWKGLLSHGTECNMRYIFRIMIFFLHYYIGL